jgi:hypothetical protein
MNITKLNQEERSVATRVGFYINSQGDSPRLVWLNGNGALSGHGREATEAEVRMWSLLIGETYLPWSPSRPNLIAVGRD